MINYETILSSYDGKLTLMQWLKKVEKALKNASATSFNVNKKGNATISFSIVFEDGSEIESNDIVLQQGESVAAARIENGHLILTLTNGDDLDAGDLGGVTSFEIDASHHLLVHFQNGTTQDLGTLADFSNADFVAKTLSQTQANFELPFNFTPRSPLSIENIYNRFQVVGNILYLIVNVKITNNSGASVSIPKFSSSGNICLVDIYKFNSDIGGKIVDLDGKTINEAALQTFAMIAESEAYAFSSSNALNALELNGYKMRFVNRSYPQQCTIIIGNSNDTSLADGASIYLSSRLFISLL